MKYIAPQDLSLLETLAILFPDSSKTTLRSWIKEDRVSVDDEIVKLGNTLLKKGQQVEVLARRQLIEGNIQIIYEDSHFVVIDKPHGILSVSTAFDKGNTAHAFLKAKYRPRRVFVVHRLDQDTSGLMLFALSEKGFEKLKKLFEKHEMERTYIAIVEGHLDQSQGTWESYLYEDEAYVVHTTEEPGKGQLAITHYQMQSHSRDYTQLKLTLETGRKNQIRVHCQEAGHPVVGDKKYGAQEASPIRRLCLHSHRLAFTHPITGEEMAFESAIPTAFKRLVKL